MTASTMFRSKQAAFINNQDTTGAVLVLLLMDEFGTECFGWEAETLQIEIEGTWGVKIPDANFEKILAFLTVLTTNKFEQNLDAFIHICNALVGFGANFQQYDPATVTEMCKTLAEVTLIDPPDSGKYDFSLEIQQYIRQELNYEGYGQIPRMLKPYSAQTESGGSPESLPFDEFEAKSYYSRQAEKVEILDLETQAHLNKIFKDLETLPLRNADQEAKKKLIAGYQQLLTQNP